MKNVMVKMSFIAGLFLLVFATSCGNKAQTAGYYDYEVQPLDQGAFGTILVKSFGEGRRPAEAIEVAKKNAVHAVIFKGIPGSNLRRPLVTNPNAETQFRDYFDAFFADDGKFQRFVTVSSDGSIDPKDRTRLNRNQYKIGVKMQVHHAELRRELEAANIVQPFGL